MSKMLSLSSLSRGSLSHLATPHNRKHQPAGAALPPPASTASAASPRFLLRVSLCPAPARVELVRRADPVCASAPAATPHAAGSPQSAAHRSTTVTTASRPCAVKISYLSSVGRGARSPTNNDTTADSPILPIPSPNQSSSDWVVAR